MSEHASQRTSDEHAAWADGSAPWLQLYLVDYHIVNVVLYLIIKWVPLFFKLTTKMVIKIITVQQICRPCVTHVIKIKLLFVRTG